MVSNIYRLKVSLVTIIRISMQTISATAKIKLQRIINRNIDQQNIFGTVLSISKGSDSLTISAGNLTGQSQYFIASVTKLFITAIVMRLRQDEKLGLDDNISAYLPTDILKELHIYKGHDYSDLIKIRHLLSHTSGLPDYFLQKRENGVSLVKELISGNDRKWTFQEAIEIAKSMQPHFKPGQKGKAFYSDTNFQLLGKIIESNMDRKLSEILDEFVISPLNLKKTYLYQDVTDARPAEVYYKSGHARIPLAMSSFWADGSIVSTAEESTVFLRSFFGGLLFPKEYIAELQDWNRIFFPFQYGLGIARFKFPWLLSPFRPVPELLGHMGTTGAFAYHCPKKDLYIGGTINQVHNPGLPYKLIVKILNVL